MLIKYLESADHVKSSLKYSMGYTPSTSKSLEISSCVSQGQRFFEAAKSSPMVIRPLLTFYGMSALAKALILARSKTSLSSLKASHGLTDITPSKALIQDMKLRINASGTFAEFNDVISKLECVTYLQGQKNIDVFIPTANTNTIAGISIPINEIWSRCPSLGSNYKQSFFKNPETIHLSISTGYNDTNEKVIQIIPSQGIASREELIVLVGGLRSKYTFLNKVTLIRATTDGASTTLQFCNFLPDDDEFNRLESSSNGTQFQYNKWSPKKYSDDHNLYPISNILPPLSGGIALKEQRYINPIEGKDISEWSLMYMGCFLLSSYCRYKPDDWMHALQSRITPSRALDNKSMVFIDSFLERILEEFPNFVSNAVNTKLPSTGNVIKRPRDNIWL